MTTYGKTLETTHRVARLARPRRRHPEWTRYGLYRGRDGVTFLAKRSDPAKTRLKTFASSAEAHAWFAEQRRVEASGVKMHPSAFAALWAAGKPQTAKKEEVVLGRRGSHVARLEATTAPEMAAEVMARWGFRGIEFGRSVSARKQRDFLANVHQAMSDLDLLGLACIAQGVGLSCGLRTIRGSSGHYEPSTGVISFPGSGVGGSLAHELWHAFESRLPVEAIAVILAALPPAYLARSRALDVVRGRRYFALPRELTARAFETVVATSLDVLHLVVNDWLTYPANYSQTADTCPWLTPVEVAPVAKAFKDALRGA